MIRLDQPVRYASVSAVCAGLGIVLIPGMAAVGVNYLLASALAFLIVAMVGFLLHCAWTFAVDRSLIAFVRYVAAMGLNLPLSMAFIWIGHGIVGLSVFTATVIATGLLFLWNFFAARWAIGGRPAGGQGEP